MDGRNRIAPKAYHKELQISNPHYPLLSPQRYANKVGHKCIALSQCCRLLRRCAPARRYYDPNFAHYTIQKIRFHLSIRLFFLGPNPWYRRHRIRLLAYAVSSSCQEQLFALQKSTGPWKDYPKISFPRHRTARTRTNRRHDPRRTFGTLRRHQPAFSQQRPRAYPRHLRLPCRNHFFSLSISHQTAHNSLLLLFNRAQSHSHVLRLVVRCLLRICTLHRQGRNYSDNIRKQLCLSDENQPT